MSEPLVVGIVSVDIYGNTRLYSFEGRHAISQETLEETRRKIERTGKVPPQREISGLLARGRLTSNGIFDLSYLMGGVEYPKREVNEAVFDPLADPADYRWCRSCGFGNLGDDDDCHRCGKRLTVYNCQTEDPDKCIVPVTVDVERNE